jgi:hypothetical protein
MMICSVVLPMRLGAAATQPAALQQQMRGAWRASSVAALLVLPARIIGAVVGALVLCRLELQLAKTQGTVSVRSAGHNWEQPASVNLPVLCSQVEECELLGACVVMDRFGSRDAGVGLFWTFASS